MSSDNNTSQHEPGASFGISRRRVLQVGILATLAPIIAACTTGTDANPKTSTSVTTSKSTALTFWSRDILGNGKMKPAVQERIKAFDTAKGTKTDVQFMNFADSTQKALAAITGGGLPTVGQQGPDVTMQYAAGGHLLQLDDLYKKLTPLYTDLPKSAVTELNGHIYGLPWWLETRVLYYHKDLLAAANVQPPKTWDDWQKAAAATTTGDQFGFIIPGKGVNPGQLLASLAASAGTPLINSYGSLIGNIDGFVNALTFLQKLFKSGMPDSTATYDVTAAQQLFIAKKAAMMWDGGSLLSIIQSTHPELLDTIGAVLTPAADISSTSHSFLGGFELYAFTTGKGVDRAPELLEFMYSDADWYHNLITSAAGTSLPVLKSATSGSLFSAGIIGMLLAQLPTAVRYAGKDFGTTAYMGQAESGNVFTNPVVDTWTGKKNPATAAAEMLTALKALSTAQ